MTVALRYLDRPDWPAGQWSDEPDLEVWTDEFTGYRCLILRTSMGNLCGYVEVPDSHPWHGLDYSSPTDGSTPDPDNYEFHNRIDGKVGVHGGLTFAGDRGQVVGSGWWFGFDCAHAWDLVPTMLRDGYHSQAESSYRDIAYVREECGKLARQLAEVTA